MDILGYAFVLGFFIAKAAQFFFLKKTSSAYESMLFVTYVIVWYNLTDISCL